MSESRVRVCVAKLGGSLLADADLAPRLRRWLTAELDSHGVTHYVLVTGGGVLVDVMRELDARHGLDQRAVHWACIELMDVTARLTAAILPDVLVEDDFAALRRRCERPGATILRPGRFLRKVEPVLPGTRLAEDWTVTSDSIAARLAIVLTADELVLVKSAPPAVPLSPWEKAGVRVPCDRNQSLVASVTPGREQAVGRFLNALVAAGYVDEFFVRLAAELPALRIATLEPSSCIGESPE